MSSLNGFLGEDEITIHLDFKGATARGDQRNFFDNMLII